MLKKFDIYCIILIFVLCCCLFYIAHSHKSHSQDIPFNSIEWHFSTKQRHLMINDLSGNRLEKMCSKEMIEKNLGKPDRIFLYDVSLPFSKDRQLLNFPQNVEEIWEYDINAEAIGYFDYYYFRIGFDKEGNYCCSEPATK